MRGLPLPLLSLPGDLLSAALLCNGLLSVVTLRRCSVPTISQLAPRSLLRAQSCNTQPLRWHPAVTKGLGIPAFQLTFLLTWL